MALARYVLTADVTVPAATAGANGTASTPGTGWSELWPVTFPQGPGDLGRLIRWQHRPAAALPGGRCGQPARTVTPLGVR
jgi:hypothetical protein